MDNVCTHTHTHATQPSLVGKVEGVGDGSNLEANPIEKDLCFSVSKMAKINLWGFCIKREGPWSKKCSAQQVD